MADQLPVLPDGIQKIALSFSGGGFRAASFSLGCASYLYQVPYMEGNLLDKVKFISSASGGSITNLMLSNGFRAGKDFNGIYERQLELMTGCRLMDRVFDILNDDAQWLTRPDKGRNLINAFALAYDQDFFQGAMLADLSKSRPVPGYFVEETCVNTTEFDNGMNFRFGTRGIVGNKYLHFKSDQQSRESAGRIKLGDILACSSCFPAGFEPLMFPRDLSHAALSSDELNTAIFESDNYTGAETNASVQNKEINFGFMDGGIDDNQGIYAYLLAEDRSNGQYDLYFTCDVTSNFLSQPFRYPAISEEKILQQNVPQFSKALRSIAKWYIAITSSMLIAGILMMCYPKIRSVGFLLTGFMTAAVILPLAGGFWLKWQLSALITGFLPPTKPGEPQNSWLIIFNRYKDRLAKLSISRLIAMLTARATSVLLLASTVYLKKIRRISYDYLYAEKANAVYRDLISSSNENPDKIILDPGALGKDHIGVTTIYLLAEKNDFMLQQILNRSTIKDQTVSDNDTRLLTKVLYPPSTALREAANKATEMDTTLWFDPNQVTAGAMEAIVATGQASMCFNLILTVYQFGNNDNEWKRLKERLLNDWDHFQKDPYWLMKQYLSE